MIQAGHAGNPVSENLVTLSCVGKDYPLLLSGGSKIRTIANLLVGRPATSVYRALSNIDLTMGRGESWGIIGENGAGKSTLLKIVAGVVNPSSGTKKVNGRISALLELGAGFHPDYSGRENVFLASALMGWSRTETVSRLGAVLDFADIGGHIDQPLKTYSTGMVVRLGFALATAHRPELLITDEVLAVGDESFQKKCLRWMEEYRAGGGALLLCSHSMYHIQSLCQNAIWIHHGECRAKGEAFAVTQAYLAYHEEKNARATTPRHSQTFDATYPTMAALWTERPDGTRSNIFDCGDDIVLCGTYHAPDDKPTVVMAGVARIDGTPVFGTMSSDAGFVSGRISSGVFMFRFVVEANPLLPGKYHFKGHTLDEHGLRLFDELQIEVVIQGKTRDHGLVHLAHHWR